MVETSDKGAFFYGTLLHPKILRRVIRNDGKHLRICPAVLSGYARVRIRNEDYPAMVPFDKGKELFNRELSPDERCTRGALVTGLTAADLRRLDAWEDDIYVRESVKVLPLEKPISLEQFPDEKGYDRELIERIMPTQPAPTAEMVEKIETEGVETEAYVCHDVSHLEPELWSFGEFLREKAWQWLYGDRQSFFDEEPVNDVVTLTA